MALKRGTKIEYTYAGGKVVPGVIVKHHDGEMDGYWYAAKLTDDAGTYGGSIHMSQIKVVDNRPSKRPSDEFMAKAAADFAAQMEAFYAKWGGPYTA